MASHGLSNEDRVESQRRAELALNISSMRQRINDLATKICQALDDRAKQTGVPFPQKEYDLPKEQARITHAVPRKDNGVEYYRDDEYLVMLQTTWHRLNTQNNALRHEIGNFNFELHFGEYRKAKS